MSFFTANGATSANDVAKISFEKFGTMHSPYVYTRRIAVSAIRSAWKRIFLRMASKWYSPLRKRRFCLRSKATFPIVKDNDFCSPTIDEQIERVSKLITGYIDVGYQPDVFDAR